MSGYARSFLRSYLTHFLWVFVVLQAFFGLAMTIAIVTSHPYVPLGSVARAFPDALLTILPVSLPFTVFVAGLLFAREVHGHNGFLTIQLAGRDPRPLQWPLVALALALSTGMFALHRSVVPKAHWQTRHVLLASAASPDALAVRLARKPRFLDGYTTSFGEFRAGTLHDFVMTTNHPEVAPAVVTARTARLGLDAEGDRLEVHLRDGRYLRLGEDAAVKQNFRFRDLRLHLDAARLSLPSKREILPLKFYTDRELALLPEQEVRLLHGGRGLEAYRRARVAAVPSVRALRWQSAFLPLFAMLAVVVFLGVHGEGVRRFVLVTVFCILLLLQQVVLEGRVEKRGPLTPAWLDLLPSLEAVAAFGVVAPLLARRRRKRRDVG